MVPVALLLGLHETIGEGAVSRCIGGIAVLVGLAVHWIQCGAGEFGDGREVIVTFHYLVVHARKRIESLRGGPVGRG